jgi:hypothetical protein
LGSLLLNLPRAALGVELTGYEYIVVGSGAGGGPLAARLALAGHKTLLIEAGDDKGSSYNYTVPAYSTRSSEDESMAWDFFVRHYADDARQARDYKHFARLEANANLLPILSPDHGYDGWLGVETAPLTLALSDGQVLSGFLGGAFALGNLTDQIFNIGTLLTGDANKFGPERDKEAGYFQIPLSSKDSKRNGAREFILAVRDAKKADGSKRYPLDVRLNCHVTKVTLDETTTPPRARERNGEKP